MVVNVAIYNIMIELIWYNFEMKRDSKVMRTDRKTSRIRNEIIVTRRGTFCRWKERKGHLRRCIRWMLSYRERRMQRGQPLATCQGLLVRIPPAATIQFDYRFSISPVTFPACFTVERVLFFNNSSMRKLIRAADVRAILYLFFLFFLLLLRT